MTQIPCLFFFFFFISCVHCFKVQEASCSASYGKNKTHRSKQTRKVNQLSFPPRRLKISLALNHSAIVSLENTNIGKINSADYFSSVRFLQGKSFIRGYKSHLVTQAFTQENTKETLQARTNRAFSFGGVTMVAGGQGIPGSFPGGSRFLWW